MKKLFLMVAMVMVSIVAMAQTNQLVWANGQLLYATPTERVDSLTYDASFEGDTLFFIMPHRLVQIEKEIVYVHDTLYEEKIVYVHDTIYVTIPENPENPETPGMENGYAYVDLGLPSGLKWATCNVGANSPEEYGDYFAWGEVEPKEYYDWSTYKYCAGSSSTMTKYCSQSSYGNNGFTDSKTVLDPEDDAAAVNWGGAWRMPTKAEQDELRNSCTWVWTTQNGVNGYKVTGPNGNSIFLRVAGYMDGGFRIVGGSWGYYWSSSLGTDGPGSAYYVGFDSDRVVWGGSYRCYGFLVRPVCE